MTNKNTSTYNVNMDSPLVYHIWTSRYIFTPIALITALGCLVGIVTGITSVFEGSWSIGRGILFILILSLLIGLFIGALRFAYLSFLEGIVATTEKIQLVSLYNGFKKYTISWDQVDRFDSITTPTGLSKPAMILKDATILYLPLAGTGYYPYRMSRYDSAQEAKMMTQLNTMLDHISPSQQIKNIPLLKLLVRKV